MRNGSRSWLYLRVSVAVLLAGLVMGLVTESRATATATTPTTSVLIPATGSTLSGTPATLTPPPRMPPACSSGSRVRPVGMPTSPSLWS
jgi:hypothetical protein